MHISIKTDQKLNSGYSVASWLLSEKTDLTDFNRTNFLFKIGSKGLWKLCISSSTLLLSHDNFITESVAKLTDSFPLHTWCFVVFGYKFHTHRKFIVLSLNSHEVNASTVPSLRLDFSNDPDASEISLNLGGCHKDFSKLPSQLVFFDYSLYFMMMNKSCYKKCGRGQ